MSGPQAESYCAGLVRDQQFPRYAASLFATPEERRGLLALYAYFGELVRVRDQVRQPLPGEIRLQWWADALSGQEHGGAEGNPVLAELRHALVRYQLPADQLAALADHWRFDLYDDPVASEDAIDAHLHAIHGPLFRLAARICGADRIPDEIAEKAGLADGLAFVLRSFGRHAARGQVLIPDDLLSVNGTSRNDVLTGKVNERIRRALCHLAHRGTRLLDDLRPALAEAPRALLIAALPLASTRADFLRFQDSDVDPFGQDVASRLAVLWSTWRAAKNIRRL
jgi:phytoene synthase